MCRNIKQLRRPDIPPTEDEFEAAALQFVRKVTGYRMPSKANEAVYEQAVLDIAAVTKQLFKNLVIK